MRILAISHGSYPSDGVGGVELFTAEITALLSSEHDIRLLLFTAERSRNRFSSSRNETGRIEVLRVPGSLNSSAHPGFTEDDFRLLLQNVKPDLIYIISAYRMPFRVMDVPAEMGIPWILHLHDFCLLCPRIQLLRPNKQVCRGPKWWRCTRCLSRLSHPLSSLRRAANYGDRISSALDIIRRAKAILCASNDLSRRHAGFGLFHGQIINVYPRCSRQEANSLVKKKSENGLQIGFVGGAPASKGLHVLAEALLCVDRPWRLKIFNIRKDKSKHKILRMFKGCENRISISGPFDPDQLDEVLSNPDVVAVPSIWPETYSRVVDEALARNVIVVASDLGGMAERLVDGVNAFIAEAGNPKSFTQKITYVIDNLDEIRKTLRFHFLLPRTDDCGQKVLRICAAFAQGKFRHGFLFDHQDEIDCINEITGVPHADVERRLLEELRNPGCTVNKAWLAGGPPKDDTEIASFYRTSDAYLYDLIVAHESWERNQWRIAALSATHRLNCKSVLDYGGGIGRDSIFFAKAGLDVAYFEVNEYLRRFTEYMANKQGVSVHFTNDVLSLRDEAFDAVYCTEVLEHVPEPMRELQQMHRLLKPGGVLIATESFGSIGERFMTHLPKHAIYAGRLSSLAGQAGFVFHEMLPIPSNRMYVLRRPDRSAIYTATTGR